MIHIMSAVQECIKCSGPVVALESAFVTHGLPYPLNLRAAQDIESKIREAGGVPATIAVVDGQVKVGLTEQELSRLAQGRSTRKVSLRDLAASLVSGESGGTTVAATIHLAHLAGIRVFVTGGIGGVHRGQPFDVSADLPALAHTPIVVVCSGAKSILDLPLTLEWLETHAVPVVGYGTDEFPAFFSRESGLPVDYRADTIAELVAFEHAHRAMGLMSAVLVCVPVPEEAALPSEDMQVAISRALAGAEREGVRGKAMTPYLLEKVAALTGGRSQAANLALLAHNAEVGGKLAVAMSEQSA
jgi:pseudouridine-5'-phosphate glycosidase